MTHIQGLKNPGITERVAVVIHFLEMGTAEALPISHITDVSFHVGSSMSKDKVKHMVFSSSLYIAEWTFSGIGHGICNRNSVKLFFHLIILRAIALEKVNKFKE